MGATRLRTVAERSPAIDFAPGQSIAHRLKRQLRRDARFDSAVQAAHRRWRPGLLEYVCGGDLQTVVTAPIIYSLLIPFAVLDVWVTGYQWICFPIYGIARVPRRRYFALDRHKLAYLNALEKLNCTFCSYANGVIAYVREVAARTELYWCPIKHGRRMPAPHGRYALFAEYGDPKAFRTGLQALKHQMPRKRPAGALRAQGRRSRDPR